MRLTLGLKMFLVLATSSIMLILSMLFFTLYAFDVGIVDALSDNHEQRMNKLSQRLGQLHAERDGFAFLHEQPALAAALEDLLWEGNSELEHLERMTAQDKHELELFYIPEFFILDPERNVRFGHYDVDQPARFQPIVYKGKFLGSLGIVEEAFGEGSITYIEAQTREFWVFALFMVLISTLMALLSANYLQRRIAPIIDGTRALTKGHYQTRITAKGQDELGALAQDFNQLATTLEQNETARRQWVEDISHEFKTPLTLMSGEIEAARDGIREITPATLQLLNQDVERLNHLVEDLKSLWQSEPGALQLNCSACDASELTLVALESFRQPLQQRNIKVQTDLSEGVLVDVDRQRLLQVLQNIFTNTLRYADAEGTLQLSLSRGQSHCCLVIEDSGPGVSSADLERLFDRLYRVERSRNRSTGGAGIGLAICRNIILAHGGSISADHSALGGLAITIRLPVVKGKSKGKNMP